MLRFPSSLWRPFSFGPAVRNKRGLLDPSCIRHRYAPHAFFSTDAKKSAHLPNEVHTVVIGGGVIGCSVAYHLTKRGVKDVLLLEKAQLTAGTTWHAAGLVNTFGGLSESMTAIRKYSRDLYAQLEAETGQSTGWIPVGFIELAVGEDRLEEFRRVAAFNRRCGVDVKELTADQVKEHFPLCRTDDVSAGFYVKEDGRVNPVDVTMALAKGARQHGAQLVEGVGVDRILTDGGRAVGVKTEDGRIIKARNVVSCTGMWARQLAEKHGIYVPNQAAEHYYLVTEAMEGVKPDWPVIEDPSSYTYIRPEGGGLMVGLFEPQAAAWNVKSIPQDFSFGEITPDWERMAPFLEKAMQRVPATEKVGARNFFCGPESFAPDLRPYLGETPEMKHLFVAAGMNSVGICTGGGVGRLLAHWIDTGLPDMDVCGLHVDRSRKYQMAPDYRAERVAEALGMVYRCHYPTLSPESARNVKRSAVYDRLAAQGAYFRDVSGWEGADWYAPAGEEAKVDRLSFGRHNWFPYWEEEHRACREGVVVMDMSFMSKFLVQGKDAGKMLNRISTANVNGKQAEITYTQWLNREGCMEADLTVGKLDQDRFMVIATDTMHRHVEYWMKRHIQEEEHVSVTDMTGGYTQLNLQGPRSRELLQQITDTDVSHEAFPFRSFREICIGYAHVLCARITYVGELGFELYIPSEQAVQVYDRIVEVGKEVGLQHAGLKALASLRLEKGYRDFGHDMDNTDRLLEVGLGFTCNFEKEEEFIGQKAVMEQKAHKKLYRRLVQVKINDPEPLLHHGEVLFRNGECVGDIRAGSYGHTLGGAVGLAMVEPESNVKGDQPKKAITKKYLDHGQWEVDIAGKRYPATVSLRPIYDPKNEKIQC